MTEDFKFAEGGDAFRAWWDDACRGPMPENPYPAGSPHAQQWETGFDDAESYVHPPYY